MSIDLAHTDFELALQYIRYTDQHVFLTGQAGTGKTSFLRRIKQETDQNMVVLAPTGVAAIHAGGVTIHSFFQLAPSLFIPEQLDTWRTAAVSIQTPETILRHVRYSAQKKELFEELEVMVIDEVSMLRADMLDAMDTMLRQVRKKSTLPFGGVRMLFIGDLFQLPPVVKPEDWEWMKAYYDSPFFFDAKVMKQCPPICIELKKVWRQRDRDFIQLLSAIRNNEVNPEDLAVLHRYYRPLHQPEEEDFHITLTTHNAKADLMNHRALAALPGELVFFDAEVEGEFPEKSYPAEPRLALKKDARIMFIRNDKGESRRYFNGKLAKVDRIEDGQRIFIRFDDASESIELESETWKNIRYRYDKERERIEEEELGSFRQFPIRLAWAITIHKSQGLTFEKAIIDAGDSFTAGQVYVALSRLTGLSGMILKSRIHPSSIQTDARVFAFTQQDFPLQTLVEALNRDKLRFIRKSILEAFDFSRILRSLRRLQDQPSFRFSEEPAPEATVISEAILQFTKLQETAIIFSKQLTELLDTDEPNGYIQLLERCQSAVRYFMEQLETYLIKLEEETRSIRLRSRQKKPVAVLRHLVGIVEKKAHLLQDSLALSKGLADRQAIDSLLELADKREQEGIDLGLLETSLVPPKPSSASQTGKLPSAHLSLEMFRSGMCVDGIAASRNLALPTVYGHLIPFIASGELSLDGIVEPEKVTKILSAMEAGAVQPLKVLKEKVGAEIRYEEIRAVLASLPKSVAD